MTDLSKLADDLIALINSKPRSPTRDEIVDVLAARKAPPILVDYLWQEPVGGVITLKAFVDIPYASTILVTVADAAPAQDSTAKFGGASALFDGYGDYICGVDPASGSDMTVSVVRRHRNYRISQAQLEKALSCDDGHQWIHDDDARPDTANSDVNVLRRVVPEICASCGAKRTRPLGSTE